MHCAKPKEQKLIKVKASFIDEISGLAIVKILEGNTHNTMLLKLKLMHNAAILDIANNCSDTIILTKRDVRDIRSKIFRLLQNHAGYITANFK